MFENHEVGIELADSNRTVAERRNIRLKGSGIP